MNPAMTWGLLAAWVVHDAEELFTMDSWAQRHVPELRARHPWVPQRLWRAMSPDRARTATAIGGVGIVIAAASAAGGFTGGRSEFYQYVLVGFGLHAISHVVFSVLARGYTPGVVTAVLVVAPFSVWAWHGLSAAGRTGVFRGADVLTAIVLVPVVIGGIRVASRLVVDAVRRRRRPGATVASG